MASHYETQVKEMVFALWAFRKGKDMTQKEVAKKTGYTVKHVCMVENGHDVPSLEFLCRYAEAIGMKLYLRLGA